MKFPLALLLTRTHPATCLALNGALLMLAGLLVGAAIPAAPYPRIMLAAHSAGFTDSGLISMLAGLGFFWESGTFWENINRTLRSSNRTRLLCTMLYGIHGLLLTMGCSSGSSIPFQQGPNPAGERKDEERVGEKGEGPGSWQHLFTPKYS